MARYLEHCAALGHGQAREPQNYGRKTYKFIPKVLGMQTNNNNERIDLLSILFFPSFNIGVSNSFGASIDFLNFSHLLNRKIFARKR